MTHLKSSYRDFKLVNRDWTVWQSVFQPVTLAATTSIVPVYQLTQAVTTVHQLSDRPPSPCTDSEDEREPIPFTIHDTQATPNARHSGILKVVDTHFNPSASPNMRYELNGKSGVERNQWTLLERDIASHAPTITDIAILRCQVSC